MILQDLLDLLETNDIGITGTDMFISELPLDKNNCLSFIASPSPDPNKTMPHYYQTVDVWARYSKYETGYNKLQEVMDFLHKKHHYEMGDYYIYLSYALGNILDNGRDAERRHILQLTISLIYRESN
jgi:hypothetical protein